MTVNISSFQPINMNTWTRREYFCNYLQNDPSIIHFSVELDISNFYQKIKNKKMRFFAALLTLICIIVNKHEEFKIAYNEKFELGTYTSINPSYTIFHDDDKSFSCIHSKFINNFSELYQNIVLDIDFYKNIKGFEPVKAPRNSFPVTCIPWLTYSSFSIIEHGKKDHFFPFIIVGKYYWKNSHISLPITFQINHAVADAFHVSCFFLELQDALEHIDSYIK